MRGKTGTQTAMIARRIPKIYCAFDGKLIEKKKAQGNPENLRPRKKGEGYSVRTPEIEQKIADLHAQGLSSHKIMRAVGYKCNNSVLKVLKDLGLK